jgi:hypothetical protein
VKGVFVCREVKYKDPKGKMGFVHSKKFSVAEMLIRYIYHIGLVRMVRHLVLLSVQLESHTGGLSLQE